MVLFEFKLISPLAIKFSQSRVKPDFQDGRALEETIQEMSVDVATLGDYDCVINFPFPPIEIVRWRPRLHYENGTLETNQEGCSVLGEETWYSLDNRRLVCLQRIAVRMWPKVAAVPVVVLDELPKQSAARKFRSQDYGKSVSIGYRFREDGINWSWMEATRGREGLRALEMVKRDCMKSRGRDLLDVPDSLVDRLEDAIEAAQKRSNYPTPQHSPEQSPRSTISTPYVVSMGGDNAGAQILAMIQKPASGSESTYAPESPESSPPNNGPQGLKISVADLFQSAMG